MFGKHIDLFKLFGFEIRIDMSWVILSILIAWSLSAEISSAGCGGFLSACFFEVDMMKFFELKVELEP